MLKKCIIQKYKIKESQLNASLFFYKNENPKMKMFKNELKITKNEKLF